jgi:hypothetical protein
MAAVTWLRYDIADTPALGAPSKRHLEFSKTVHTPGKRDQGEIYSMLAAALQKKQAADRTII